MTAIDEVRAKLEASGLGGRIEKTYHKLLRGYWWFPDEGESVYLGASKDVALVAIDAEKYGIKRQRERDMAHAGAKGASEMCPKCNTELSIWQRQGAPWKASCLGLGCGYQKTFWPDEEEFEPSLTQHPAGDTPSCLAGEDERY